jgi:hypothetical protein
MCRSRCLEGLAQTIDCTIIVTYDPLSLIMIISQALPTPPSLYITNKLRTLPMQCPLLHPRLLCY